MILTFERKKLLEIIAAVEAGSGHRVPYTGGECSCPVETTPGLLLVDDEGVYLLGNETPGADDPHLIAYANEANPRRMSFGEYRVVKEACFGGDDGAIFLELERVKSDLLAKSIPYIDFTSEGIYLGSVDSLEELFESPDEEEQPIIEINEVDELVDTDAEDPEDETELIGWRQYRGYVQISFDFAVKEVGEDPEEYDYNEYHVQVDLSLDPGQLWAKCYLKSSTELSLDRMDISNATFDDISISSIAVNEMLEWHEEEENGLVKSSYQITCSFNLSRLPEGLIWKEFQKVVINAFEEISPNSTLLFEDAERYSFAGHESYDDAFLQFLVYRWIVQNRPELSPHSWLLIHSAGPNNCFPDLITSYYGWPRCEVHGCI